MIIGRIQPYAGQPELLNELIENVRYGIGTFIHWTERRFGPLSRDRKFRLSNNEAQALTALALAVRDDRITMPLRLPSLVFFGKDEKPDDIDRLHDMLPNATFVSLDGLDRLPPMELSDLILSHVTVFLRRISRKLALAS